MSGRKAASGGRGLGLKPLVVVGVAGLAAASIAKELRLPAEERTWHGFVAGLVPYDYRLPTLDRVKEAVWDPEGPAVKPRVFGLGWSFNLGRFVADIRGLAPSAED